MPDATEQQLLLASTELDRPLASSLLCETILFTDRCPGKETANEDAAGVALCGEQCGVLVVADGMGGAVAGEQAARLAVETVCAATRACDDPSRLRAAVLDGIETANERIRSLRLGAGCTLAVVELQGGVARPYHVGDAAILVVGQRGKIKLQTVSHSPVGMAVEAGVLDDADAMHHEDRHIVSNAVGCEEMRIEIGPPIRLAPRDTVLLASDGLFDNLHVAEIVQTIRKGPLVKTVAQLVELSQRRMTNPRVAEPSKPDDLTVIAYRPKK